ncbi:MAG: hypothetical protein KC619_29620, partial [Myxococcales bacterium]|nr:hypothetical protein [Myxococcales bacterium]
MRWNVLVAALAVLLLSFGVSLARAQDYVGLGDGSDGPYVAPSGAHPVNEYEGLTAAPSGTTLTVRTSTGFAAGDLILVWQVKAGAFTSGDGTAVDLAATGVGHWELTRVVSTTATTVVIAAPLSLTYAATGTQIVRVPEFTDVTIGTGDAIIARPWDGNEGGIVVFLAAGTVRIATNGGIAANEMGFRGGDSSDNICNGSCACGMDAAPVDDPTCDTGRRGEGFDNSALSYGRTACGVGNRANGGGGGGHINAGGAGGGNGGAGSVGGNAWCSESLSGGNPSAAVTGTVASYLTLGGGGGGGQQNNDGSSAGAGGGGVIFVRARRVTGAGEWFANGGRAVTNLNDGQGGGGAGGTIFLQVLDSIACGGV